MKKVKIILLLLLLIVIYLAAGACLPFVRTKRVSEEFKQGFDVDSFYGTGSPDRAAVVETSQDALDVRLRMLDEAREKIVLSTFDIRPGQSCSDVFAVILAAADRGVDVKILVDGLYGWVHMAKEPMFYGLGSHPNITFKFYNTPNPLKPWTINGRMHDKYVLIDDRLALLGGRNTFDYFLGEYNMKDLSYDRDVLIYNTAAGTEKGNESAVSQVYEYYEAMWASKECRTVFAPGRNGIKKSMKKEAEAALAELRARYGEMKADRQEVFVPDYDYEANTIAVDKVTLISNPTHIMAKEPWIFYQLQQLMMQAEERVYIHTPYAVFSNDMYDGIAEVCGRLDDVSMLVNSVAVGDNFMASSDYVLSRKKILETKVKLYEYQGDHSSHGKSLMIDHDISVIGSYNLDMRSTYVDTETMLVIQGEEFQKQLEGHLMNMEAQSLRVNEDGSYEAREGVEAVQLPGSKRAVFSVTSLVFQLFRYLI